MPPVCDEVMASMLVSRPAWAWVTRQARPRISFPSPSQRDSDIARLAVMFKLAHTARGSDVTSAPASCGKSGGKGAQEMH
jgi:hypothetical protein